MVIGVKRSYIRYLLVAISCCLGGTLSQCQAQLRSVDPIEGFEFVVGVTKIGPQLDVTHYARLCKVTSDDGRNVNRSLRIEFSRESELLKPYMTDINGKYRRPVECWIDVSGEDYDQFYSLLKKFAKGTERGEKMEVTWGGNVYFNSENGRSSLYLEIYDHSNPRLTIEPTTLVKKLKAAEPYWRDRGFSLLGRANDSLSDESESPIKDAAIPAVVALLGCMFLLIISSSVILAYFYQSRRQSPPLPSHTNSARKRNRPRPKKHPPKTSLTVACSACGKPLRVPQRFDPQKRRKIVCSQCNHRLRTQVAKSS